MKTNQLVSKSLFTALFAGSLFLSSSVFAQVKVGTNPTTINAANNLEVEASGGSKVSVDKTTGKVTIADGSQGAAKILTSDANGVATWQSANNARIPLTVWIGQQSGSYTVPVFINVHDALQDRVPLVPDAGALAGYDPATKRYTIQESGYYRIHAGAYLAGTTSSTTVRFAIALNGQLGPLNDYAGISTNSPTLSVFWEGYLAAGEVYSILVENFPGNPSYPSQLIIASKGFMSLTKLF